MSHEGFSVAGRKGSHLVGLRIVLVLEQGRKILDEHGTKLNFTRHELAFPGIVDNLVSHGMRQGKRPCPCKSVGSSGVI